MIIILLVPICVYWRHWGDGWLSVMSDIIDNYLIRLNNYFCSLYISHWPHIATLQDSERHITKWFLLLRRKSWESEIWFLPVHRNDTDAKKVKVLCRNAQNRKTKKKTFATISKWTWRTVEWNAVILFATKLLSIL